MKKQIRLVTGLASLVMLTIVLPANGQAPPPPAHGQNGNQTSPGGGTGCPLDRTESIMLAVALSFSYAGFSLYHRGKTAIKIRR